MVRYPQIVVTSWHVYCYHRAL